MTGWRLVCDVGGTNARFARANELGTLSKRSAYAVSQFKSFALALQHYVEDSGGSKGCTGAAIGAAGPVHNGTVRLTNASWFISEAEVSAAIDAPCTLVNDVQAVAFSLCALPVSDLIALGPLQPDTRTAQRLLAANMGTGFGAATLIRTGRSSVACPSEAGHMGLALPGSLGSRLSGRFLSVEHVLSGGGLSELYAAMGNGTAKLSCREILARVETDKSCSAALQVFTQIAGNVLGDLTLAVAAWGGVFLCGTVARAFAKAADLGLLREAFEDKGPMKEWMQRVPTALITNEDAALTGLAVLPMEVFSAQFA